MKLNRFACFWVAMAACACAQKEPPASPESVDSTGVDAPVSMSSNLDELEGQLAAAERQLNAQLGASFGMGTKDAEKKVGEASGGLRPGDTAEPTAQPAPGPAPPPTGQPRPSREVEATGGAAQTKSSATSCETVCKALASMERSADRICELTSSDDNRCTRARKRVQSASKLVDNSGCSCGA